MTTPSDNFLPVTRIAPTPSGFLHMGNLINFIITWIVAKSRRGTVFLRIDDIDSDRVRIPYLDDIFFQLEKLGIIPDGGPGSCEEHLRKYSQRFRMERYEAAIHRLRISGKVFNCSCSRKKLSPFIETGYPGECLHKNLPYTVGQTAVRLHTDKGKTILMKNLEGLSGLYELPESMSHSVVWRRDDLPAYQLASVCDDVDLRINCIVRGTDLLPSSLFQLLLSSDLSMDSFLNIRFLHHGILTDKEGKKLSKSQSATPVKDLPKSFIIRTFTDWTGWPIKAESLDDLVDYAMNCPQVLTSLDSLSN